MAVKRILRVITRLNIGGPAIQALMLTKGLEPTFATTLATGTAPPEEGELSDPEVPVTRIPLVRPLDPRHDLSAFLALRRLLGRLQPDILHTHMAKAGSLGRAATWGMQGVRTVHTFHGHVLEGYFSRLVERAFVETERRLAKRTDALVAVSHEVRDSLLGLGIGSPSRFHVIPLGFDLEPFLRISSRSGVLREALSLGPDTYVIGVLGRLAPIKDHRSLLSAISMVENAHLVVMGDGEERDELERLSADLHLTDRVHFLGWRTDVAPCLADLDLVVLTSRNEGTPVSLIEAAAAALPVVSTDVGGVRSVVRDGITGVLVPAGDPPAVAAAIERVMQAPSFGPRLGEAGRAHVTGRFSKERLLSDVIGLYDQLLGQPRLEGL